ncbi:MAG TPA: thioredoxin domain-containing protein [Kofleriaceae bacterium]|nr:thioredoxin domain-containing protein [Kofleriaceae bacterium]
MRRALVATTIAVALAACGSRGDDRRAATPARVLPASPVPVDLGREPIVNPLNLWEMMIEGSPDHETVGTIGARRITTRQLDDASGHLLTRIGDRVYLARDAGWRALLEREGLRRAAAAANQELGAFLAAQYATLPSPTRDDLARMSAHRDLAAIPERERIDAARSLWRQQRWLVLRSVLVADGLRGVLRERLQLMLVNPAFAPPTTSIGKIGDHVVTRAELHLAAGYEEQLARREYFDAARTIFDELAAKELLENAATAAGVTSDELIARERAGLGPPPEDEVARFIAENPAYASERARAVDAVRTLREVGAKDTLVARLAKAAGGVTFLLREPAFDRIPVALASPRRAGSAAADAPHRIEILHCVGGPTCAKGSALVRAIVARHGARARVELGDYWTGVDAVRLRHAIAMRCAGERDASASWAMFEHLVDHEGQATTALLVTASRAIGVDERAFRACLADDRHLPEITEDTLRAQQLGLDLNILGVWVDGWRIDNLGDLDHVHRAVQRAVDGVAP